jgi:hydrogenase nickel incorporation protein HypA/HybF
MHELSIVMSVVDIAQSQTQTHKAKKVDQIELEIGSLSGIEMDAFLFAWDAAIPNTVLEKAERVIHHIPAIAKCTVCQHEYVMKELFTACPNCGDFLSELLQGKELRVKTLTVS